MTQQMGDKINIFYSYAANDSTLQKDLENHLTRCFKGKVAIHSSKHKVIVGSVLTEEYHKLLGQAHIILLLISADYLASNEYWTEDMQHAREKHDKQEAIVIPIFLRPCVYEHAPFRDLPILPKNKKPITQWSDRDLAFTEIAQELSKIVKDFKNTGKFSWQTVGTWATIIGAGIGIGVLLTFAAISQPPPAKSSLKVILSKKRPKQESEFGILGWLMIIIFVGILVIAFSHLSSN